MADKVVAIQIKVEGTTEQNKKLAKLETEVKKLTNRRRDLNKALKEGTISLDKYGKEIAQVNTKLKAHRREMLVARENILGLDSFTKKLGKSFNRLGTSIGGAFVGLFAVQKFFQVVSDGIKTIEEFEQQMANVLAVTGATEVEFKALTDSAKELGRTSLFTSMEVGQLQEELAKLGFTTPEILAASDAILQLATASGAELSQSAVVAASTLRGFGLEATETQRVVDVMAKSFSSSSLDISKFQTAMASVAPVAKTAGFSVERTTALLGTLTDAGFDASTAGTGLRNIFLEISKRGITLEEAFSEIKNSSDKTTTALELFDKRGAALAITLADNETKSSDLADTFNNAQGAAKDMADVMGNTSVGATKKLESAWDGLILTMGEGSEEGFASFKTGLANFLNDVTDFIDVRDKLLTSGVNLTIGDRYFGNLDESKVNDLKRINKEEKFLTDNLKNRNLLQERANKLSAENKRFRDEEFSDENRRKRAADELTDAEEDRITWIRNQRAINEQALSQLLKQLSTLKEISKEEEANAKKSEIESEIEAKTVTKITDLKLSELKKLDTEEAKTEIKRRKAVEDSNKKILASNEKLSEQIRKLKQDQLILEIEDEREAEFQKLSIQEENAIREVELSISTEKKKIEAIKAIQEKFQAERTKKAKENAEKDAELTKKNTEKAKAEADKEKEKSDAKKAQEEKEAADEKEILRDKQIAIAEETANLLSEISTNRVERQKDLALSSLNAQLEQGLINQQEFDKQREDIERTAFEKQKKIDVATALANGAIAITKTIAQLGGLGAITPIGAASLALVGAQTAAQVGIINSQKFEDGGVLSGASHADGGIPFTVGGVGGFEAEGGEAIINKRSTAMFAPLLSAINQAGGGVSFARPNVGSTMFANGGIPNASSVNVSGLRDEIAAAVSDSINTIQVVNNATDTVNQAVRVNNIVTQSTFG
jgi:hypothetical protein